MAISFIGFNAAADTTVSLPAHQAGDLIVIYAYRNTNATAIALAAGFTNVVSGAANNNADRLAYKIATSSSESAGTWTNAEGVIAHVYRGIHPTAPVGASTFTTNVLDPLSYPALTASITDGTSWIAAFAGVRAPSDSSTPPPGMVSRSATPTSAASQGRLRGHDTDSGVASFAGGNGGATGGNRYRVVVYEIKADPNAAGAGRVGSAALTEGNDAVSSSSKLAVKGSSSTTLASDLLASTARLALTARTVAVEGGDTVASSSRIAVRGTSITTEQNDQLQATASVVAPNARVGSLNVTEGRDMIASAGRVVIRATIASVERDDALQASSRTIARASLTMTERDDAITSAGNVRLRASLSTVEASDVLIAEGTVVSPVQPAIGTLSITEADDRISAYVGSLRPNTRWAFRVRPEPRIYRVQADPRTFRVKPDGGYYV